MGVLDLLKPKNIKQTYQRWKELGVYKATFTPFGQDIYQSDTVRSCIRALAEFTSKAEARCPDRLVERLLNNRPNLYMNGHDFLYKVRTALELKNTVFICITRDDKGRAAGFYPVPCARYEAIEYMNGLFIKFYFSGEAARELVFPWEDIAVLRKDYCSSDISGDDNIAILPMLETLNTTNQGIANAVKSTANLRGILKATKSMLAKEDIRKMKDEFVRDYMSLENEGGIASLDATQEFTPIKMEPTVTTAAQQKEFRENVYRYFGVNDKVIMGSMTPDEIEAFYELRIEPFLVALSKELTSKVYTAREQAFGNWIVYEANKLQFASLSKKIQLYKDVVLYGGMTVNEWRAGCNMAPIPGGDELIMRLDAAKANQKPEEQPEGEEGDNGNQE